MIDLNKLDLNNQHHQHIFNGKVFSQGSNDDDSYFESLDPVNEYKIDKYGFRSELAMADILVAGCSFTFGVGVPKEATWGSFLGRALDLSVSSVGIPGASTALIVEQIYKYFRTYGHPKKVFCLFPDLGRVPVVADEVVLSEAGLESTQGSGLCTVYTLDMHHVSAPKYLKKPYPIIYTTTLENAAYWSVRSIRALEQYCSAAGIDFVWSSWDVYFTEIVDQLNTHEDFSFDNYFNVYDFDCIYYTKGGGVDKQTIFSSKEAHNQCEATHKDIECSCGLSCHSELIESYGPSNFHLGGDVLRGADWAHPGVHLQAHYAEAFLRQVRP